MDALDIFKTLQSDDTLVCSDFSKEYLQYYKQPINIDSFQKAIDYGHTMQPLADHFYKGILDAIDIKRYNWNDSNGKFMQKRDVDCSIQLKTNQLDTFWLNVSEKFRQIDTGDMCLELWSDFEKEKLGWVSIDSPDCFLYTTPKHFFWVNNNSHFKRMIQKIYDELTREKIKEIFKNERKRSEVITVDGCDVRIIRSWTENKYYGICVCIPWTVLINKYFLDIFMCNHEGKKLSINEEYL